MEALKHNSSNNICTIAIYADDTAITILDTNVKIKDSKNNFNISIYN